MGLLGAILACEPAAARHSDSESEGCNLAACHAGIEQIHYGGPALRCVDCHGGDPRARTKKGAHVTVDLSFNPSSPGSHALPDPSLADLATMPTAVAQFLNPADYRVVASTCGSSTLAGGGCHTTLSQQALRSNHATMAGQLAGGLFLAGIHDKTPRTAVVSTRDPNPPAQLQPGFLAELQALGRDPPDHVTQTAARSFFPVFEQLCVDCHLLRDGPKDAGRYYSSGCNGCHMLTSDDGRAATGDATQDRDEPGHVRKHRFSNLIPDSQCARCHFSHLHRSLLARGVRERSEPDGDQEIGGPNRGVPDPKNTVPWDKSNYVKWNGMLRMFGKPWPFYVQDEDGTNAKDETPPDVHSQKGLACIDCHNLREMHGPPRMAGRMDLELDVRCESCHGRPGQKAKFEGDSGMAFTTAATAAGGESRNPLAIQTFADGRSEQRDKLTGMPHPVTQITTRTTAGSPKFNRRTLMGCALHAGTAAVRKALKTEVNSLVQQWPAAVRDVYPGLPPGFVFALEGQETDGRVECFACHNTWTLNCYGCHMVRDDRQGYASRLTGQTRPGKVTPYGLSTVADALSLGFNARGKVTPMVGTSIFFTHVDKNGQKVVDAEPLRNGDGKQGDGNLHNPAHHHTVQQFPRDCQGCHPRADGIDNREAVLRAAGLGTGRYTFQDGKGKVHVLDKTLRVDRDGDGFWDEPAGLPLPVTVHAVDPIAATTHERLPYLPPGPQPGPLDVQALNRLLGSPVLPQRP